MNVKTEFGVVCKAILKQHLAEQTSKSPFHAISSSHYRLAELADKHVPTSVLNVDQHNEQTALAKESGEVVYTPPVGEDLLRALLSNWEKFIHNQQDLDPLVRMAVGHYQFEAIHPFTDGNGRTGRVLSSLFLINEKLLSLPILYLSSYIIDNKDDYYRLLMEITTKGNWEQWLLFIIKGVEKTAERTKSKIEAIRLLFDHTSEYSRSQLGRIYSYELVSLIFELPYCRIQDVVDAGIAGRQAASRQLKQLVDCEVLTYMTIGREKLFVHPKLLKLLTKKNNKFKSYPSAGQNE